MGGRLPHTGGRHCFCAMVLGGKLKLKGDKPKKKKREREAEEQDDELVLPEDISNDPLPGEGKLTSS